MSRDLHGAVRLALAGHHDFGGLEGQPSRLTAERGSVPAMLEVGDPIPEATVFAGPREPVTLASLVEDGPILLVFYLFDWSST